MLTFLVLFTVGCGERNLGNPSSYSYEEYSDYTNYHDKQQGKLSNDQQSVETQSPDIPENVYVPSCDANKATRAGCK
jgi:hypothetical protein